MELDPAFPNDLHRRGASRLRLLADGRFMGIEGNYPVTLLDLSQTGAKIAFDHPLKEKAGFLSWMSHETFGEIVWQEGLYVGLQFDQPIAYEWLLDTRMHYRHVDEARRLAAMRAARDWVSAR